MQIKLNKGKKTIILLIKTGFNEIIRDPKIFFFIMIFPVMFLGIFAGISSVIHKSKQMNISMLEFMFPGILIFALLSTGLFGTTLPLVEMRKNGIMRLLTLTPLTTGQFVISQIIVRLILSVVQITLFLILGMLLKIVTISDLILLLLVSLIGMIMILSLGFLFGGFMSSVEIAGGILGAISAPILMLSGVMMPFYIMPDIVEDLAIFIPFTYMGDALRQILFEHLEGKFSIYTDLAAILGFAVLFFVMTKLSFKWSNEKI